MVEARMLGLDAKMESWVFITSLASSGDETTMVETSPSRMCISGPCFLAKSLNARWGREPIKWCMLPMIGSFDGPGVDLKLLSFQDHHEEQEGDQQDWEG
jgi:hypothetical protein